MKEHFKVILNTNQKYYVSNYGNIYSVRRNRIISPALYNGRELICLYLNGKKTTYKIHKLVYETFKGPTNDFVTHIDGNVSNNYLGNLQTKPNGYLENQSVNVYNEDGKYYFTFYTIKECADYLKVTKSAIYGALRGSTPTVRKLIIKKNLCPLPF